MNKVFTVKTTIIEKTTITISRKDLIEKFGLPEDCKIFITTPGGGDYSNTDLDIEHDVDLTVEFDDVDLTVEFEEITEDEKTI